MANSVAGTLVWNLDIDNSGFNSKLNDSKNKIKDLEDTANTSSKGIQESIVNAFQNAAQASQQFAVGLGIVGAGLVAAAGFGIKYAANLETMRAGFVTLLGSTNAANAAITKIQHDAATTPFTFPGLVSANQLLTSVTKNSDESERLLLNVGKALTAMGKGQPELDRIIVNLQQIGAIGHANAIDIKQFAYAGIPIYDLLNAKLKDTKAAIVDNSKAIGDNSAKLNTLKQSLAVAQQQQKEFTDKTKESTKLINSNKISNYTDQINSLTGKTGSLTAANGKLTTSQSSLDDAISNGKITFKLLEDTFNQAGEGSGRFAKAFKEQGGTFNQVFSNLQDNIGITANKFVQSTGIFNDAKKALIGLTNATQYLSTDAGLAKINGAFDALKKNIPIIVGLIIGGLAPAIVALVVSFAPLIPFLAIGAAIGAAIEAIIYALGGWDATVKKFSQGVALFNQGVEFIKGKIQPLVPIFKTVFDRIGQLISGFGVSGQFGGVIAFFAGLASEIARGTARALQILGDYYQKAKNFLSFGTTGGQATIADALQGIYNRLKPLIDTLEPLFAKIGANLALTGQIIQTQVKPAFDALVQASGPLIKALEPFLKDAIKNAIIGLAIAIGSVIAIILGIFTGIVSGLANALPYITQSLEGLIQFIRGVVQIITGLLTGNLDLAWEGLKQAAAGAVEFVVNGLESLLKFVSGFVEGIVTFFVGLYNALVGHSIIPDMVNEIVAWFESLPISVYNAIVALVTIVPKVFMDAWTAVTALVAGWVSDVYNWGANIASSFTDGIKSAIGGIVDAFKEGLNKAKKLVEGHSPPLEGPFKDIDKWGFNVGNAWVQGVQKAIGGLSLSSPSISSVAGGSRPALAGAQAARSGPLVNVESMTVSDQSDITDIARELAFRIETSTGFTQ